MSGVFKCYRDICQHGVQYCVDTQKRCYWCKDASSYCWTPNMPHQCNEFCNGLQQQLMNKSYSRGYADGVSDHNGQNYPFIISTSIAVIAGLLCGLLGWIIYRLRKRLNTSRAGPVPYSVHDQESPETIPLTKTGGDEVVDIDITDPADDVSSTHTTGRHASVDSGLDNRDSFHPSSAMPPCACIRDGDEAEVCIRCASLKQLPPRNDADSMKTEILCG